MRRHRFALTAFSPLLFNIALIARDRRAARCCSRTPRFAALVIAATVGIAGLLQLLDACVLRRGDSIASPLAHLVRCRRCAAFVRKAIPGMIASSGPQLLIVAGAIIASASPSAVSWLYFANRLIELPLGIVGVAMGTVLVPEMTRALQQRGSRRARVMPNRAALELAVGLALPATLGLIVLSEPIVRMLFEHGAFTAADTRGNGAGAGLARARPARPCPGQGAVSGLLRARAIP